MDRSQDRLSTNPYVLEKLNMSDWVENGSENSGAIFEKYNYYFTGQDVKIYVDGLGLEDALPTMDFAFKIEQQKTPIYGFWSYSYDQILRGTRIVQGVIRIATKTTDYMTRVIAKAANSRAKGSANFALRGLDLDAKYIEKYWDRNIEADKVVDRNIFLIHPPFNFIIIYGIEDLSICIPDSVAAQNDTSGLYKDSVKDVIGTGDNRYLIEADPNNNSMRRVIEGVELTSKQVEYNSSGQVCSEVYNFIAKDEYTPNTDKAGGAGQALITPEIPSASTSPNVPGNAK